MRGKTPFEHKIAALILSFLLVVPHQAFCLSDTISDKRIQNDNLLRHITINKNIGTVIKKHCSGSKKWVIQIQDYHAYPSVQQNIAAIIKSISDQTVAPLQKYYTASTGPKLLVGIEGHSGPVESSQIRTDSSIPSMLKKSAARYFIENGIMSGSEYLDITQNCFISIQGLENESLYQEDKQRFLDCIQQAEQIHRYKEQLNVSIANTCSDTTACFISLLNKYLDANFTEYNKIIDFIADQSNAYNIDFSQDIALYRLHLLLKEHSDISYPAVMNDAKQIMRQELSAQNSDITGYKLLKLQTAFIMQKCSIEEYVDELVSIISQYAPDKIERYRSAHSALFDAQDHWVRKNEYFTTMAAEMPLFPPIFDLLAEQICSNTEMQLYNNWKMMSYLDKLTSLQLSRIHWNELQLYIDHIRTFLSAHNMHELIPVLENAIAFYTLAEQREEALVTNLLSNLESAGPVNGAVLITGGFHTTGISTLLEESDIDYYVIAPVVDSIEHTDFYHAAMSGEQTALEKKFSSFLSQTIAPPASTAPNGRFTQFLAHMRSMMTTFTGALFAALAIVPMVLADPPVYNAEEKTVHIHAEQFDATLDFDLSSRSATIDNFDNSTQSQFPATYAAFGENNLGTDATGIAPDPSGEDGTALFIHHSLNGGQYWGNGMSINFIDVHDLSAYAALSLDVYSDEYDQNRTIGIELLIQQPDGSDVIYSLKPEHQPTLSSGYQQWRGVWVPLDADQFTPDRYGVFDLTKVVGLQFLLLHNGEGNQVERTIYIDDVQLWKYPMGEDAQENIDFLLPSTALPEIVDDFDGKGLNYTLAEYAGFSVVGENILGMDAVRVTTDPIENDKALLIHHSQGAGEQWGIAAVMQYDPPTNFNFRETLTFNFYSDANDADRTFSINIVFDNQDGSEAVYALKPELHTPLSSAYNHWTPIRIPLELSSFDVEYSGRFNLSKIKRVELVLNHNGQGNEADIKLYLDDIALVPGILKDHITDISDPQVAGAIAPFWWDYENSSTTNVSLFLSSQEDTSWMGLVSGLKAIGIPFNLSPDLNRSLQNDVVIVSDLTTLSPAELQQLEQFVSTGGTLIAAGEGIKLLPHVFGINDAVTMGATATLYDRHITSIKFDTSYSGLTDQFTHPREQRMSIRRSWMEPQLNFWWTRFILPDTGGASPIAVFDDDIDHTDDQQSDNVAITRHDYGSGKAYALGINPSEYILMAQSGVTSGMGRDYINTYEPSADTMLRFLKHIFQQDDSDAIVIRAVPHGKGVAAMFTHDVDAYTTPYLNSLYYAAAEYLLGAPGTYFIQTKYDTDGQDLASFNGIIVAVLNWLHETGMEVASHSVAHSIVFSQFPLGSGQEEFQTYHPINEQVFDADGNPVYDQHSGAPVFETPGGTVLGELMVSKQLLEDYVPGLEVKSFRSGHLEHPSALAQALDATGYTASSVDPVGITLSNLPFRSLYNRDWGQPSQTANWHIPLTIEDELDGPMITRTDDAIDIARRISRYGGSFVVLIHPNIVGQKLDFQTTVTLGIQDFTWFTTVGEYSDWLNARDRINVTVEKTDAGSIILHLDVPSPIAGLTIEIPTHWSYAFNSQNAGVTTRFEGGTHYLIINDELSGTVDVTFYKLATYKSAPSPEIQLGEALTWNDIDRTGYNMQEVTPVAELYGNDNPPVAQTNGISGIDSAPNPDLMLQTAMQKQAAIIAPASAQLTQAVQVYMATNNKNLLRTHIDEAFAAFNSAYRPGEISYYIPQLYESIIPFFSELTPRQQHIVLNAIAQALQMPLIQTVAQTGVKRPDIEHSNAQPNKILVLSPRLILTPSENGMYRSYVTDGFFSQLAHLANQGVRVIIPVTKEYEQSIASLVPDDQQASITIISLTDDQPVLQRIVTATGTTPDNMIILEDYAQLNAHALLGRPFNGVEAHNTGMQIISATPGTVFMEHLIDLVAQMSTIDPHSTDAKRTLAELLSSINNISPDTAMDLINTMQQSGFLVIPPDKSPMLLVIKDIAALVRRSENQYVPAARGRRFDDTSALDSSL